MSTDKTPTTNQVGLTAKDYKGAISTLCTGCGHDSVTTHIQQAFYKSSIHPFDVVKISGIGCSSKTTAYFMNQSFGFNTIHGRMAAVATGVKLANPNLNVVGVSGDGDTASIGLGSFLHLVRRNTPMVYIIENNGVYGLTKGQFSATADSKMIRKSGEANDLSDLDLCSLAIESGCGFVARSFSGDGKQFVSLLQAAIEHNGTAVIDVISPCITYANHEGSTKSYDYVKSHKVSLQQLGYVSPTQPASADYSEGEIQKITLASGNHILLKKIDSRHYDPTQKRMAMEQIYAAREAGQILTGLIYYKAMPQADLPKAKALTGLDEKALRPSQERFNSVIDRFV